MSNEYSLQRTTRALLQAITTSPNEAPIRGPLLAFLSPFYALLQTNAPSPDAYATSLYQESLKKIVDFADDVIGLSPASGSTPSSADHAQRMDTLTTEAVNLHAELERRGLFTAFSPSYAQQRLWDRIVQCFSNSLRGGGLREPLLPRQGINYCPLFQSVETFLACLEALLNAECGIQQLSETLLRYLRNLPVQETRPVPSAQQQCPQVDIMRFIRLFEAIDRFYDELEQTSLSESEGEHIKELFYFLRFTGFNYQDRLTFSLSPSSIRFPAILRTSSRTVQYPASLQVQDDPLDAFWSMSVVVKVIVPDEQTEAREMFYRYEALRVLTLIHPCLLVVHDVNWPERQEGQLESDVFVITERMSHNLQQAAQLPMFRSHAARIRVLLDVAKALEFLHKSGVAFQQLCPEQVLVRVDQDEWHGCAKVDVSCLLETALFPRDASSPACSLYAAPEKFEGANVFYTGDIWALGILACFLFTTSAPTWPAIPTNATSHDTKKKILVQTARSWCNQITNPTVRNVVQRCLHVEPSERPPAATLSVSLEHALESIRTGGQIDEEVIGGEIHEEVIGGENHGDSNMVDVIPNSRDLVDDEQSIGLGSEDCDAAPLNGTKSPTRQTSKQTDRDLVKDPDWSTGNGRASDFEARTSASASGEEGEAWRKRQPSRRAKAKRVDTGDNSSCSPEPRAVVENVTAAVSIAAGGQLHAQPNRVQSLVRGDLGSQHGIPGEPGEPLYFSQANKKHESGTSGLEITGEGRIPSPRRSRKRSRSSSRTANGSRRALSSSEEDGALLIGAGSLPSRARGAPNGAELAEAEKQNSIAEGILETGANGCIEKAAALFKQAADLGSAKAQVNYGHCLEQGRGVSQDYCQAALYFQEAAKQGDARGQFKIGLCHELGRGTKKDFRLAVQWYTKAAMQGDAKAQANLGMAFEHGRGTGKDLDAAVEYYRRAAEAGNSVAQLNLGVMYENGRGVPANLETAVNLYDRAANGGNNRAMLNLALCYENGRGVARDMTKAAMMHIKAADAGNAEAQFRAAQCFETGTGVKQSMLKASALYKRAAEQDHIAAMYSLGVAFEEGQGLMADHEKAFKLYKAASDQGHAPATFRLATCYEKGKGVKKSPVLAVGSYKTAAQRGNADAKVKLGYMYENGQGVKKSIAEAVKMYRQAAAVGNAAGEAALGQCHYFAFGMLKNLDEALRLYEIASAKGNPDACVDLGNLYKDGVEVQQDFKKAFALYQRGAYKGKARAHVQLGECFYYGRGVEKDYKKAVEQFAHAVKEEDGDDEGEGYRWLGECFTDGCGLEVNHSKAVECFQRGATRGSTSAQTNLGCCYERGQGVPKNGHKALYAYKRAADKMNTTAMNNLGILYEKGGVVKQDYAKAFKWYAKAVEHDGFEALCNLADCYAEGNGVEKDLTMAVKYYKEGAVNGLPEAQCELGICFYYGKGVDIDYDRAIELFRTASASEPEALRYLGIAHYDGDGLSQDNKKAVGYFLEAADKGNTDANLEIGGCYEAGHGVEKNCATAAEYYQKAVDGGNMTAMRALGNLYYHGQGVKQDHTKAVALFEKSASLKWEDVGK